MTNYKCLYCGHEFDKCNWLPKRWGNYIAKRCRGCGKVNYVKRNEIILCVEHGQLVQK